MRCYLLRHRQVIFGREPIEFQVHAGQLPAKLRQRIDIVRLLGNRLFQRNPCRFHALQRLLAAELGAATQEQVERIRIFGPLSQASRGLNLRQRGAQRAGQSAHDRYLCRANGHTPYIETIRPKMLSGGRLDQLCIDEQPIADRAQATL